MYAPEWANTSPFDLVRHKTNLTGSRLAIERQLMTIKNISACFVNVFGMYLFVYCFSRSFVRFGYIFFRLLLLRINLNLIWFSLFGAAI